MQFMCRARYDEALFDRSESETNYTRQIELHGEKERKLTECIELLEQKIIKLLNRSSASPEDQPAEPSSRSDKELLLAESRDVVAFYQQLTGSTIQRDGDTFVCTVKNTNKRQMARFSVTSCAVDSFEMIPIANPNLLPDYLQMGVIFEKSLAPLMLGDVLGGLFAE